MGWHDTSVAVKDCFGHHEAVAAAAEMRGVFELFCKEITGVYDARNVSNLGDATLMALTNIVFAKIDVLCAFVCA
jgi:hypothetical protein